MNNRPGILSQVWERSTLLSLTGTVMILLLVVVIIVGSGLHSSFVWLILAIICIVWVLVCSCNNCNKVAGTRTRQRSDTVSTISDLNDLSYIGCSDPMQIEEARIWATLDLPPSYDVVSNTLEQQPPSYASVVTLLNSSINSCRLNIPASPTLPPPYTEILHNNNGRVDTCINYNGNNSNHEIARIDVNSDELTPRNRLSSSATPISMISGSNLNESAFKITNIDIVLSEELPTLLNESQILSSSSDTQINNVNSEEHDQENSTVVAKESVL